MKVKLTLSRRGAAPVDVVVTADSTATAADVARHLATSDPARCEAVAWDDVLTLAVAPPGEGELKNLDPAVHMGEAAIGSGFRAAVVNLGPAGAVPDDGRRVVGRLLAVEGPLAGREFQVRAGHSTLGRQRTNDIVVPDAMVSKRHLRIEVGKTIELVDLNSANGVIVDGVPVQRVRLAPGGTFEVGSTTFVLDIDPGSAQTDPVLERGGGLMFNRSPRVDARYPGTELPPPRMPTEQAGRVFPWLVLVAPIVMAVSIYAITGRERALLLIALTPMMALGNFMNQRSQAGVKREHEAELFERQFEKLEETLFRSKPEEEFIRNCEVPPVAEVYEHAVRLGPLMWTRRPEHWNYLAVRLGTTRALSRNTIAERDTQDGLPSYIERLDRLRDRYRFVDDVPVLESFRTVGSVGVAGPVAPASDAMRGLAVQLFGLHAPTDLVAVAMTGPAWTHEMEWLKWLPHTTSEVSPFRALPLADSPPTAASLLSSLEEYVLRAGRRVEARGPLSETWHPMLFGTDVHRAGEEAPRNVGLTVLLFVTHDAPVDRARLMQVLEQGADVGVHAVFYAPTVESLPAACRSFIDVTDGLDAAVVGQVRSGQQHAEVLVEGVNSDYMDVFARRMAPVVDASTVVEDSTDVPSSISFLSLVGSESTTSPDAVVERWRQNNTIIDRSPTPRPRLKKAGTLRAIVGQGATDVMTLDLRSQGPHALVGGTTGAGKSEFLQAWVLGLAAAHSPDRVTFLFVDYKGGAAFADCVDLPHCVGLVTDLSPHLVRRALTSLRAELHHRERLLNRKKAKDLLELERRQDPECPPALVLVIDEFAALAGEIPEFVDGVVDIAQRGRSLGIHLIMATQRPAGVIKDNLRANTNLRVALRMADESDSKDVVDEPVAASFPASLPGRAIAKTGPGRLTLFQSAYAGGWTDVTDTEAPISEIRAAELRFGSIVEWETDQAVVEEFEDVDLGPNDQKRIVDALIRAAEVAGLPTPRRPWLDSLATTVDLRDLPSDGDGRIALGLADVPEKQQQNPIYFLPDRDGSLLVFGTSGSGKTTLLRTIATAAGMRPDLGKVEVYGMDFASGGLGAIQRLPHVGSVIDGEDSERVQRLLRSLGRELDMRAELFASASTATLTDYRDAVDPTMSRIVLLIDNYPEFKSEWEISSARASYYQIFMRLLGEGRTLGVHAVLTADRGGAVPTAVMASISRRVVLRLADPNQYTLLGAPKDVLDDQSAPGRAVIDKQEVQVAVLGGTSNFVEQSRALDALADELRTVGVADVPEIGALPVLVAQETMPAQVGGEPVIGIAEDTLGPRTFDPVGLFVVAGPPQSGRTTALRSLIRSVERFDPDVKLFHFGTRRSQLTAYRPWVRSAVRPEDEKELALELTEILEAEESSGSRIVVIIEDVPHLTDGPADRAVRALMQAVSNSEHLLVGEADIVRASSSAGVVGAWKSDRQGIALRPDTHDGDALFKMPFGRIKRTDFPVGRGIFVQSGRAVAVQVPLQEG